MCLLVEGFHTFIEGVSFLWCLIFVGEENKSPLIRVWKTSLSRRVLKLWGKSEREESPKRTSEESPKRTIYAGKLPLVRVLKLWGKSEREESPKRTSEESPKRTIYASGGSGVLQFSSPLLPNQCGTSQSTPFGASILTGTPPCVYPLRETARRIAHRPVSGSNTICNDPDPPLAYIVFFGLSLLGFPSRL